VTTRRHLMALGVPSVCGAAGYGWYTRSSESSPAVRRKQRSEERLRALGVMVHPGLPTLPLAWTESARSARDVAVRVLILRHVAGAATVQLDVQALLKWFKREGVLQMLSAKEARYLNGLVTSGRYKQDFDLSWRYEAAWFLCWSLGMFETLNLPFDQVGLEASAQAWDKIPFAFDNEDSAAFVQQAQLRPGTDLLDELDFTYRAHWATRNKTIDPDTAIGQLNDQVLIERHRAGNWLMALGVDWDAVSTST
jgi:hypothetical protein